MPKPDLNVYDTLWTLYNEGGKYGFATVLNKLITFMKRAHEGEDGTGGFGVTSGKVIKQSDQNSKQITRFKRRFISLDAFERHKQLVNNYMLYYPGATDKLNRDDSKNRGIYDVVRENHRFLWGDEDLTDAAKDWDKRLAKKYYDKLYKEYCIADLSRFEKNKIGLRWRTEKEVLDGKGQFKCGEKHCEKRTKLSSWEVNFQYQEHGEHKNALVKVRLCPECSLKLNFHSQKRKIKTENGGKKRKKHRKCDKYDDFESDQCEEAEQRTSVDLTKVKTEPSDIDVIKANGHKTPVEEKRNEEDLIWTRASLTNDEEERPEDEMEQFFDDLLL